MCEVKQDEKLPNAPRKGWLLSLLSGILACLAGTFGKFALADEEILNACESLVSSTRSQQDDANKNIEAAYFVCSKAVIYLRVLSFVIMIILNAAMWMSFVKALRLCGTTLEATVTNTAANFLVSALLGRYVFNESTSLLWLVGTILIIFGLALMNYSEKGGGNIFGSFEQRKRQKRKLH